MSRTAKLVPKVPAVSPRPFQGVPPDPICVRIATAVELTGMGRSTLYELINAGALEVIKVGRSTFIRYDSLKRLFDAQ